MKVEKVYINTYKYDFHLAKICIASIRYWYPDIPIYLIKDEKPGKFRTKATEKAWNVSVVNIPRKKFGWGYGKLETLFLTPSFSFLVLDADTVLAGPILDVVKDIQTDFIVDDEVQPENRFNEIYYNLERINELDREFVYPGYSFNSGQWFGTTGKIKREDFESTLKWNEPPVCRFPEIVFNGDQAHLNFLIHRLERKKRISVTRKKIMIWPYGENANYIDIDKIKNRSACYPLVIHWAGMGSDIRKFNRVDIIQFYKSYFYSKVGLVKEIIDSLCVFYLTIEKKVSQKLSIR